MQRITQKLEVLPEQDAAALEGFQEGFGSVAVIGGDDPLTPEQQLKAAKDAVNAEFLLTLLEKRKEAVTGRESSGIELEWMEDEEHYQGIDDANRHLHAANQLYRARRERLMGTSNMAGGGSQDQQKVRSLVFPNITRPYCEAASAKVADMLLPTDDRSWEIQPTPIPTLSVTQMTQLAQYMRMASIEQVEAELDTRKEASKMAAEKMQDAIDDLLTESNWHGEVRQVIEDSARIGAGVIKGPFPMRHTARISQLNRETGRMEYIKLTEIKPGSKRIDPWNFFPDPSCGENIALGSYTWEREYVSRRQIKEMMEIEGYDIDALQQALREGAISSRIGTEATYRAGDNDFELWIFYGHCASAQLRMMGVELEDDDDDKLPTMAVILNDKIINIVQSPQESGAFPYDVLAWQRRPGLPWGVGIARQIRTAQRILTGNTRALMDNLGLSAAPQIVIGQGVTPQDGTWTLRPGKVWRLEAEANTDDVRKAFHSFTVTSVQPQLQAAIDFALRMAEDTTGMPAMLQGIRGDAPDTLGGMQMQNNNSTSVLRRLAKRFDDYVTTPHVERYFDWQMQYSDDQSIKGDFKVDVRGSSALLEREAQQQFMTQLLDRSLDPRYRVKPHLLMREVVKGQRLDPDAFMEDDEEFEAAQAAQPEQPQDPTVQAKADLLAAQAEHQRLLTELETIKAEEVRAKIEKLKAETAAKNVEAMYSATEAAKNIAMAAPLAAAADAIYKSAGGEDKDLPPAIPTVEGMPQEPLPDAGAGMEPQTNTNPLTPINPPTPDSPANGMMAGIEGGGQEPVQEVY